jgi:hypothetical protein
MQRNGKKMRLKKSKEKNRKKLVFSTFCQKGFDMDFPKKVFNGVFELPLSRNAQKRHLKKKGKKESDLPSSFKWLSNLCRFQLFFS